MILNLHGSMGDHLILTGIPQAIFEKFGEKTKIIGKYSNSFWNRNPFVDDNATGSEHSIRFNSSPQDYMIYYPVRVFHDITGTIIDRKRVQPNLYIPRQPQKNLVIINDQAGWPSRRGYRYFQTLATKLMDDGYNVCYLRNNGFRDCIGQSMPMMLSTYSSQVFDPSLDEMISLMSIAWVYIGYESGLSSLAGALKIPTVTFYGSVPPVNTLHDTCIFYTDDCKFCHADQCQNMCLETTKDYTDEILEKVKEIR